nr:RepB family plasmid replication initiator protein [Rhodopseudomonas rhenobacensis]
MLDTLKIEDHQLFAYLRSQANGQIGSQPTHTIPAVDARRYLDCTTAELVASLERLGKARIQITGIDKNGAPAQFICGYLSSYIRDHVLEYSFDAMLLKYMSNPAVFSLLHLDELRRFKSAARYRLYEVLSINFRLKTATSRVERLSQEQLHYIFGDFKQCKIRPRAPAPRSRFSNRALQRAMANFDIKPEPDREPDMLGELIPAPWPAFSTRTLRRAVEEFNQVCREYNVHAEYRRNGPGGKVVEIMFTLHRKRPSFDEKFTAEGLTEKADSYRLYEAGFIPRQETLLIERKREERGLTPVRSRRRSKIRRQFDSEKVESYLRIDLNTIYPDVADECKRMVAEAYTDCIHDKVGYKLTALQVLDEHIMPEYNAIAIPRIRRGEEFDVNKEVLKFVRDKCTWWTITRASRRKAWRTEIFRPGSTSHLAHTEPEPGDDDYVSIDDILDGKLTEPLK